VYAVFEQFPSWTAIHSTPWSEYALALKVVSYVGKRVWCCPL